MVKIQGISFEGDDITITGDGIFIDGRAIQDISKPLDTLKVEIIGNPRNVITSGSVIVHGDVLGYIDAGGSVRCINIEGSVNSDGSVNCGNVGGNIDAGGSVRYNR